MDKMYFLENLKKWGNGKSVIATKFRHKRQSFYDLAVIVSHHAQPFYQMQNCTKCIVFSFMSLASPELA